MQNNDNLGAFNGNNLMQMMQQFQQFKRSFTGDPRQEVMRLVQQGRISQSQLDDLQRAAAQFQKMIGG